MKQVTEKTCCDVVIVGGGFSGTILTVQLLSRSSTPLSILIVNRAGKPGRGVAYGTECDEHILNVSAGKMSAIWDDPEHFLRWLRASGHDFEPGDFAPRRLYGQYLEETLYRSERQNPASKVSWVDGTAISLTLRSNRPLLILESGDIVEADIAVLAIGSAPPSIPVQLQSQTRNFFAPYAWAADALMGIPMTGTVLILGSGLTAIDQVLALNAQRFTGTILLLSRHGRLPMVDFPSEIWPADWVAALPGTLSSIVAFFRRQVQLAAANGVDWRAVVDSLRPQSPAIWQGLAIADRKQFLRHVVPYWEVARHRIPQKTHGFLQQLVKDGRLHILAGQLLRVEEHSHSLEVTLRDRGKEVQRSLGVHRVINCTGSGTAGRLQEPLIRTLLEQGLARLDPLELGVETTSHGSLISKSGTILDSIYGLGPVRKASLWETTAVSEIRIQAVQLAERILTVSQYKSVSTHKKFD